jgi:transposase
MTKNTRPTYSTEFKLEAAQLVVDGDHSVREAAELMNVSKSAMDNGLTAAEFCRQNNLNKSKRSVNVRSL